MLQLVPYAENQIHALPSCCIDTALAKKENLHLSKPFPRRSSPSSSSSSHRFFFALLQSKIGMWTLQETTIIRRNPFAKSSSCTTRSQVKK
jgi:hypothetical protein